MKNGGRRMATKAVVGRVDEKMVRCVTQTADSSEMLSKTKELKNQEDQGTKERRFIDEKKLDMGNRRMLRASKRGSGGKTREIKKSCCGTTWRKGVVEPYCLGIATGLPGVQDDQVTVWV